MDVAVTRRSSQWSCLCVAGCCRRRAAGPFRGFRSSRHKTIPIKKLTPGSQKSAAVIPTLNLDTLRQLNLRLDAHVVRTSGKQKAHESKKLATAQVRTALIARAYFYHIYFEFLREPDVQPLAPPDVFAGIFVEETSLFSTPGYMCAQILLRALKSLRSDPKVFAAALLSSHKELPMYLFAFSTFPAMFHCFCNSENIDHAIDFLMALVSLDAPPELVRPLFLALLFSTFTFADALWTHLHREFCAKQRISERSAIVGLCRAIEATAPLIPDPVFRAIRELHDCLPTLCGAEMMRYLKLSFELWFRHSAEGMSFGCGELFAAFLDGSADFYVANSKAILAAILECSRRVPFVPVHSDLPEYRPESIVFSFWDFDAFRRAFEGLTPKMPLFETIVIGDKGHARFSPFLMDYFPAYAFSLPPVHEIPMVALDIPALSLEPDQIFEQAIAQSVPLADPAFEEYRLKKSIIVAREMMAELEDLFRFRLFLRRIRAFQASVRRWRDYCFTRYCGSLFCSLDARHVSIEKVAEPFLSYPCARSFIRPFLAGLLNFAVYADPPADIARRFAEVKRAGMMAAWGDVMSFVGLGRVIELVPEPTRRQLTGFGDIFLMLSHVFSSIHDIAKYFSATAAQHRRLVKFLSVNSEFDSWLKVFLFFDRRILQAGYFTPLLDQTLVQEWSLFVAVMYEMIAVDPDLCAAITNGTI